MSVSFNVSTESRGVCQGLGRLQSIQTSAWPLGGGGDSGSNINENC